MTTLQSHIQDLKDAQYQMDPVYEKSVITSSMQHSEYKAMNDGFINNNTTILASEMIAQFIQKETRDAGETTSQGGRRNINFTDSGGNSRRGNGNGKKHSDNWIEKEIWLGMTIEERKAHLKKHRKPRREEQSEQPSDALTVPTSNYSHANTMNSLISMDDHQFAMLANMRQQAQQQMQQLQMQQLQVNNMQQYGLLPANNASGNNIVPTQTQQSQSFLSQVMGGGYNNNMNNNTGQARLFNVATRSVLADTTNSTRITNTDIPKRDPIGHRYLLDLTDMEDSDVPDVDPMPLTKRSTKEDDDLLEDSTMLLEHLDMPALIPRPFDCDSDDDMMMMMMNHLLLQH